MKKSIILLASAAAIGFSGCSSVFMPYKEDFACNLGPGEGYCGSMKKNYKRINNDSNTTIEVQPVQSQITEAQKKEQLGAANGDIFDNSSASKDTMEAIWLKQRALEKKVNGEN